MTMGSRSTQLMGLNSRADALLDGLIASDRGLRHDGMFPGEEYPLHAWVKPSEDLSLARIEEAKLLTNLDDVRARIAGLAATIKPDFFEYVQDVPWSSGPMYFIALTDADGTPVGASLWTDEEMAEG
jgi:hypothetical protein